MSRRRRAAGGFSLVETLVALAVLALALLSALAVATHEPLARQRLLARRLAVAELAARNEALRAGAPPRPGVDAVDVATLPGAPPALARLTVTTEVTPRPRAGLCEVAWTARYTVGAGGGETRLVTLAWRPGGGCP